MKVLYARVSDELYDAVEVSRAKERRSQNMQVQILLEKALEMTPSPKKTDKPIVSIPTVTVMPRESRGETPEFLKTATGKSDICPHGFSRALRMCKKGCK